MPGESPWTKEPGGLQSIGSHSQTRLKELSIVTPPSLSHISGQSPETTIPVQLRKALQSALTVTPLPLPRSPSPSLPLSCLRISDWPQRSLDGAQLLSLLPGVLMKGSGQSPYQAQSSVHFTVSRGQLTPHPPDHPAWLRKGGGCPHTSLVWVLGRGAAPSPANLGYGPQGLLHQRMGLSSQCLLWSRPVSHACRTKCLPTSLSPRIYLHSALIPPPSTFTELLQHPS